MLTRAFEVTQWVKVLAARPGELNLIPGTDVEEGENRFLQVVL